MSEELKTIKFQLMLAPSEAKAIDDWGFAHRIRTRAEAIRRLCQIGIVADRYLQHVGKVRPKMHDAVGQIIDAVHSETEVYSETWLIEQLLEVHESTVELGLLLDSFAEIAVALAQGSGIGEAMEKAANIELERAASMERWRNGIDNIKSISVPLSSDATGAAKVIGDRPHAISPSFEAEVAQSRKEWDALPSEAKRSIMSQEIQKLSLKLQRLSPEERKLLLPDMEALSNTVYDTAKPRIA